MKVGHVILGAWAMFLVSIGAALIRYGLSPPIFSFGAVAIVGFLAGISALRGWRWWRLAAAGAALVFLALTLTRHIHFVVLFLSHYSSPIAAVNQYLFEHMFALRNAFEQREFFSLFMHAYSEWVMPLMQLGILVVLVRNWVNLRSNQSPQTDRPQAAGR
jgi:hypothetical protein